MTVKKVKAKAKYNGNHIFSGQEIEGYYYYYKIKDKEFLFVNIEDSLGNICWNGAIEIENNSLEYFEDVE